MMIMKHNRLRLVASVSPRSQGEWRRNVSAYTSRHSKFTSLGGSGLCRSFLGRFQCEGLESLGRAVHSLLCEDDFSELGPPVMENGAKQLKLATEKPEPQLKTNPASLVKLSWNFSSEARRSIRDVVQGSHKISQTSKGKLQDQSDTTSLAVKQNHVSKVDSAMTIDQDKSQKLESSRSVSIENIPSTVGLSDLVQAMSVFGKVSCAHIRSVPDGLDCCDVEFVNSDSSRRAVLAGGVTLESIHLPIYPLHSSDLVIIRIEGIGVETTDPTIRGMCKSIGALEGLAMDGKDAVNAFYRVKNDEELQRIVRRLNNTIVNDHRWSAYQLPCKSAPVVVPENGDDESKLGLQWNNRLVELKRHMGMKKIYIVDLELLHLGILHLQGLPTNDEPCVED